MKSKVKTKQDNFTLNGNNSAGQNPSGMIDVNLENKNRKQELNEQLMMRLAMGQKVQVSQISWCLAKEMCNFNSKFIG